MSSIEKWGDKWEEINLERLYILLREQLALPDDPFVIETLKWWNEFRRSLPSTPHILMVYSDRHLATRPEPKVVTQTCVTHSIQACENAWKTNGVRGCE